MSIISASVERLSQEQRELDALYLARGIADGKIHTEERLANNKLLESVKPELHLIGSKWAKAFVDTRTAHLEYDEFLDRLEDAGANVGPLRMRPNGLSHPNDASGNYFFALQEFVEAGFLLKSELSKAFK